MKKQRASTAKLRSAVARVRRRRRGPQGRRYPAGLRRPIVAHVASGASCITCLVAVILCAGCFLQEEPVDCSDVENVFRLLVEAPPGVQKLGYADLLGSCGAPAAELCRDKLTSSTSSPRELGEALIVLGRFENGNDRALVVSFLDHEDIEVRQNAALAAARYDLGPEWGNIVSALEREQSLENKVLLVICVMKTRDPRGHEVLDRLESSTSAEELHRRTMFGSLQGSIEHARKYLPREPDPVPEGK